MSFDKSFKIQSDDQDDWKFILQANYFYCHFENKYSNTQRADLQRWILSVTQNYSMEWCNCFFKTLFECFDSNIPLDESLYLLKVIYWILVDSSSWQQLLVNASWIQSPSKISTAHYRKWKIEKQSRKSLQSTLYQRTLYLLGYKDKISKPRRKEATIEAGHFQNASNWGRALLQTWVKQFLNGSWFEQPRMQLFRL